jgi:hypothetical protein
LRKKDVEKIFHAQIEREREREREGEEGRGREGREVPA